MDTNLILSKSPTFFDHRGQFTPINLKSGGDWVQSNISISDCVDTFRGLHYQRGESAQKKLIKVIRGSILDFVVDLRVESSQYMKLQTFELSCQDQLLIPNYYAHGFLTLQSGCIVQYLVDCVYSPGDEATLFWSEVPELMEILSGKRLVISDKDTPQ